MTTREKWFGWAVMFFMVLSMTAVPDTVSAAYPEKVINWIIPWGAGGRTDVAARILAPALEKGLVKPVIIVNKPGADGVMGSKEAAKAKPDGYTMMLTSISLILTQYTAPTPTNLKDYILACQLLTSPALLNVNSKAPRHGVRDFIEYAKANPKKIKKRGQRLGHQRSYPCGGVSAKGWNQNDTRPLYGRCLGGRGLGGKAYRFEFCPHALGETVC